jgi:hypothetical protein
MVSNERLDFEGFLKTLPQPQWDEAEERRRAIEYRRIRVDEWRRRLAGNLPNWRFAERGNREWVQRCNPKLLAFLDQWKPMVRDGKDWKLGPQGVIVSAPPRHGKSTGIYAAIRSGILGVRAALEAGEEIGALPSMLWTTEAALVDEQRQYRTDLLDRCGSVGLLVIDEFGLAGGHQAATGATPVIMQLLGMRHDRNLPTAVTSGISQRDILARYGAGVHRRLTERAMSFDIIGAAKA